MVVSPWSDLSARAVSAGLLAGFVGVASSFAVVLQGLIAVGASPEQAVAGLMALCVVKGLGGIVLSLRARVPVALAWSTPGGALLAASPAPEGGFAAAVGAFLVCGALLTLAGLWRPLGRWVAAIPASLAGAMLAGVLLPLCLAPVRAVAALPLLALPVVLAWVAVAAWKRLWAVPAAVVLAVALVALTRTAEQGEPAAALVLPLPVWPDFSAAAVLGIGVPLFLVTMAAQNIPGMAVLAANGYRPEAGRLFAWTGALSLMAAPFGGHALNLAAITAALCAGPEAQPDPARRYWAAAVAGAFYVVFGLLAGAALALVSLAPPLLLQAIAGLALLGTLAGALRQALDSEAEREAATVTFLLSASGVGFLGIGGPFWGLLAGGALLALRCGR